MKKKPPMMLNRIVDFLFISSTTLLPLMFRHSRFSSSLFRKLLFILISLFAYGLLLLFTLKTKSREKPSWLDEVSFWFETQRRHWLSPERASYLQYMRQHYHFLPFPLIAEGEAFALEDVWVELYLAPPRITLVPQPAAETDEKGGAQSLWSWLERESRLLITGAAGSGKTTLLQYTLLALADEQKRSDVPLWVQEEKPYYWLPILLTLPQHAHQICENSAYSLSQAIFEMLVQSGMPQPPAQSWIEEQLYQGQCLIMLDALSEVADQMMRQRVMTWVQQQMDVYGANRFILSTRFADEIELPSLAHVTIQPLTTEQQDALQERITAQQLLLTSRVAPAALAHNPLTLTMYLTLPSPFSQPEGRSELYDAYCGRHALRSLAYDMMTHRDYERNETRMIQNGARAFLIQQPNGSYRFRHLTLQEYLAAEYICEQGLGKALSQQVDQTWWYETIRFYSMKADFAPIVEACLAIPNASPLTLKLATACIADAPHLDAAAQQRWNRLLGQRTQQDASPTAQQTLMAKMMLSMRLKNMRQVDEARYVDDGLITHVEYQRFLDDQHLQQRYHQPDHWPSFTCPPEKSKESVVGIRSSDAVAFCDWLTEQDQAGWHYRLPYVGEFDTLDISSDQYQASHVGYWVEEQETGRYVLENKPEFRLPFEYLTERLAEDVECARQLMLGYDSDYVQVREMLHTQVNEPFFSRGLDLSQSVTLPHNQTLKLVQEVDIALVRTLARVGVRARARAEANERAINLVDDFDIELEQDITISSLLARALALSDDQTLQRSLIKENISAEEREMRRWYTRFTALLVADVLLSTDPSESLPAFVNVFNRKRKRDIPWAEEIRKLAERYFALYLDLVILEERIKGRLVAFEGIRVVKERL